MSLAPKRDPGARSRPRKRSQAPGPERGATPFWGFEPLRGQENRKRKYDPLTLKCYLCSEPTVLPMY